MSNVMRRIVAILGILVGIIIIFIGLETTNTYISTYDVDSGIRFGADFYTEIYDVTSDVGKAVNYNTRGLARVCEAIGWLIFSIGIIDVLTFTYLLCAPKQKTHKTTQKHTSPTEKTKPAKKANSTVRKTIDERTADELFDDDNYVDVVCPRCKENLSFLKGEANAICPWCETKITL